MLNKGGALSTASRHTGELVGRGRLVKVVAIAVGAVLATALPASAAQTPPDPQTTNIPYTAWAGTQLRLVKCSPLMVGIPANRISVSVESFSGGATTDVTVFTPSIARVGDCARVNVASLKDGLARIKLKVFSDDRLRDELLEHQFLAIWMRLGTPTIDEVGSNDPTAGPPGSASEVGDPAGDGAFTPASKNGRVQVKVTGSFPHPLAPSGRFTLPTDWPVLARALAQTSDRSVDDPSLLWDIHDTMSGQPDAHVPGFCTTGVSPLTKVDQVDNCNGGGETGPFSRVFGDSVTGVTGPFDPVRPRTLLTDGQLTADDAPMPAARVDIAIAPNTAGQIDGAGALEKANKSEVYSRDGNGSPTPHNLYAPYYRQFVPATAGGERSSGTDWLVQNNFGLNYFGEYDNWDTISLRKTVATATGCNRTVAFPGGDTSDSRRMTPSGDRVVAVFTDEHGEAQVEYRPFAGGFYYDGLSPDIRNANRGCDLQGIATLGTSSISATAKYPGQPVDFPDTRSGAVAKRVGNLFDKSLHVYAKGTGAENANARIVVAHGQDVDGKPFAGERACFYVNYKADSFRLFSGVVGTGANAFRVDTRQAATPSVIDPSVRCAYLDDHGNAALEVFNSGREKVNVIAEYIDEGLLRSRDVDFSSTVTDTTPPPSTPPAAPGDTGAPNPAPSTGPGTTAPTAQQAVATMGTQAATRTRAGSKAGRTVIVRASFSRTSKGRYLMVKVSSPNKTAKLAIRLLGNRNKVLSRATRTVKTNKTVRVMKVSSKVKAAKLRLVG
jgi:hypothetical protein